MPFLPTYGTTLGPVGIPMADDQAFALDAIFKQIPAEDQRVRKAAIPFALLNLASGLIAWPCRSLETEYQFRMVVCQGSRTCRAGS